MQINLANLANSEGLRTAVQPEVQIGMGLWPNRGIALAVALRFSNSLDDVHGMRMKSFGCRVRSLRHGLGYRRALPAKAVVETDIVPERDELGNSRGNRWRTCHSWLPQIRDTMN
jgi:hypothetical protein